MAMIPHLRIPFRFGPDGSAEVVEQNSQDEIAQCVAALAMTRIGQRIEVPEYGIPDQPFQNGARIDTAMLVAIVERWEPRAQVEITSEPNAFDDNQREMQIRVRARDNVQEGGLPVPLIVAAS